MGKIWAHKNQVKTSSDLNKIHGALWALLRASCIAQKPR